MKSFLAALVLILAAAQDPPPKETPKEPPPDPFVVKVTDMVRSRMSALVSLSAGPKVKFEEATAQAAKLETSVLEQSAEKLGLTVDEIRATWAKRGRKSHKVTYGDGSWIALGGQDGGLDSNVKGTPIPDSTDLVGGGPSILTRRKPPPPAEPVPLGKALKTKEEWWVTSSPGERTAYVEAEFVRNSTLFEKKEEAKKCSTCSGKGTLNVKRGGIGLITICHRCHGAKEDLVIVCE
jgi:hypothetical protein